MRHVTTPEPAAAEAEHEVHASWPELFFDLVAVAGVSALAHVLVGELSLEGLGLYLVMFLAFWMAWTSFMLYGNVRGEQALALRLLLGMFGIGVMSACVPGVAHGVLEGHRPEQMTVFAAAYVAVRVVGSKAFDRQVVLDFPVVQQSLSTVPWLVSIWVDDLHVVLALWVAGLAIDALGVVMVSSDEMLEKAEERYREVERRVTRRPGRDEGRSQELLDRFRLVPVSGSPEHLAERMGLFIIIVLGEGVVQVVHAASEAEPARGLFLSGGLAFALLSGLFGLSVRYGYAGVPHLRPGVLPVRFALGVHGLVSALLAAVAVALAGVVEHGHEPLGDDQRWLLCACVAAYFVIGLAAALGARGTRPSWSLVWLVTGVVLPLVLALVGAELGATALTGMLLVAVLAHVVAEARLEARVASPPPGNAGP